MNLMEDPQRHAFYKRTRKGKIIRLVEEKYSRDDLQYGILWGNVLSKDDLKTLLDEAPHQQLLVLDTNIMMHQLDVLEYDCPATAVIVVLQTVLQELRKLNLGVFRRVLSLLRGKNSGNGSAGGKDKNANTMTDADSHPGTSAPTRSFIFFPNELCPATSSLRAPQETMNDFNDRLIRLSAAYFARAVAARPSGAQAASVDSGVLLVSNDAQQRERAVQEQASSGAAVKAISMSAFVSQYVELYPELCDLMASSVAATRDGDTGSDGSGEVEGRDAVVYYPPHIMPAEATQRVASTGSAASMAAATAANNAVAAASSSSPAVASRLYKGMLQCRRGDNCNDCYIVVHLGDVGSGSGRQRSPSAGTTRVSVTIKGRTNVNRAISGDLVAVELISEAEANAKSKGRRGEEEIEEVKRPAGAAVAEDTAEATAEAMEGLAEPSKHANNGAGGTAGAPTQMLFGRVVSILRRQPKLFAGSIDLNASERLTGGSAPSAATASNSGAAAAGGSGAATTATEVFFVPVDRRIPAIRITSRRLDDLVGQRLLVAVDHWPATSLYPFGHYVRSLGADGEKNVETAVLLHEYGVPTDDFSAEVMGCLPPSGWSIGSDTMLQRSIQSADSAATQPNMVLRQDLRWIDVVSIDPPGCKDIDDALHCRRLPNGNFEVGVHIADVTHFVHPDTPLDKEAAHRSTSTYLVERRLDMLPSLLTTELCSLRSKEDHLAFSVLWEMDNAANIVGEVRFCKSVIHSVASLTYDEAQTMLDSPDPTAEELATAEATSKMGKNYEKNSATTIMSVKMLNHLAILLRKRRIEEGALTLASTEVRFKLDAETQSPTDVTMYALKQANALVEEWMLLANITVSKKILRHFPTLGVLRRHQPPSVEQFAPLLSAANAVGVQLDIHSSKALADSLDRATRADDPYFNKLLRILSTRCMMPAQYFCSGELPKDQWHHYGLAAPVYTHFTSPIRRYADVIVHRLLAAAIGVIALPASNADRTRQQEQCSHMNKRHKAAQYAQRASVNLHTLLYFKDKPSVEAAYVLSVLTDGIVVLVPRFGIEGTVSFLSATAAGVDEEMQSLLAPIKSSGAEEQESDFKYGITALQHDPVKHTIQMQFKGKKVPLTIQVFQQVNVKLTTVESNTGHRHLDIELQLNESSSSSSSAATTATANSEGSSEKTKNSKKQKRK